MTVTSLGLPAVRQDAAAHPDGMPLGGPLVDTFGRVATDLRVSLTDRCNLRCTYCMPAEGLDWLPGDDLLTLDELTRLLTVAVTRVYLELTGYPQIGNAELHIAHALWGGLLLFLVCQHRLQQGRSDPAAARWGVALLFGLIHGFGFASVLVESELPASRLVQALIGFNVGVEFGQIALLAACRTLPLPPAEYATIIAVPGTEVRHVPFHRHRSQDRLPAAAVTRRLVERGSFGAIHCGGDRLA